MEKSISEASKIQIGHLDPKNYKTWIFKVKLVLDAMPGAMELLDGTKPKPTLDENASAEQKLQYEKDLQSYKTLNSAISILLTTNMTDETLQKVLRFTNASDMWLELERLYGGSCMDQTYNYCLNFFSYKKKEEHDIATHISVLKNIWSDLNLALLNETHAKQELPDILLMCKIIDTLPTEYLGFESSWLLIQKKDRTIENLTSQLCAHERVLSQSANEPESSTDALYAKADKRMLKKRELICNYCKNPGHRVRACKRWIADGRPPKETSCNMNLSVFMVDLGEAKDKEMWYVDNGATSHVTNIQDYFQTFTHFKSRHTVTGANGQCIDAIGMGDILAEAKVEDRLEPILLKNVWYVPKISRNLFSVLAAHDRSEKSQFESTPLMCSIKIDGQTKIIGTREKNGGLYKLRLRCNKTVVVNELTTSSSSTLQLYHERFGHQSKTHVEKLLERKFNIKAEVTKELLEGCIYGKSHQLKFGTREKATRPGEFVYTDVCGPLSYSIRKFRFQSETFGLPRSDTKNEDKVHSPLLSNPSNVIADESNGPVAERVDEIDIENVKEVKSTKHLADFVMKPAFKPRLESLCKQVGLH